MSHLGLIALNREVERLLNLSTERRNLHSKPHLYPKKERICVQEAHALGIPLIGIADTNCDPEELDYVIPGNDDAIRAVKLIVAAMADAVIEAKQGEVMADVAEGETEETAADAE